tara:strand:+ start:329 stop:1945 length:1617 start_codon:yes stop_codon:yes gene_type:complete
MENAITNEQKNVDDKKLGTLAIDLGNTTTVVAFQGEKDCNPTLIDLPPISRIPGEVPSLLTYTKEKVPNLLVGQQVLNLPPETLANVCICSDFKRWIGFNNPPPLGNSPLSPEKAGELLIQNIWERLPSELRVKRLVLTAPVETYRAYKTWLTKTCRSLLVDEIALVDEPTAAAMGAGVPAGSKLLVIDIGGCTIDLSLVALEGGEGRAEPIAELLRFDGEDLEGKSRQSLRCAKVLGKAGIRLGGRDIDKWIANSLCPNKPLNESLLNAAERLKCRLSENDLRSSEILKETYLQRNEEGTKNSLELNRDQFEQLLIERGLIKSMQKLLSKTLQLGEANNCKLKDLHGVVLVGGGARIPLIRKWLKRNINPATLLTPPPIEAVAKGALSLTPGVTIRDVLQRGASLRCWDKKSKKHIWHPLFVAGQPFPTSKELELVLSASSDNQAEIELVIGEPREQDSQEVIYIDGIPTIKDRLIDSEVIAWEVKTQLFYLNPPGEAGKDCLRLNFSINSDSYLQVKGIDLRTGIHLKTKILGLIN